MLDRRRFLLSSAALAALTGLTACGGGQVAAAPVRDADDGFLATVSHELGSATLGTAPTRIVCGTDGGELCSLLALGVKPAGFGRRNDPLRPWVRDLAAGIDSYDLSGG